MFSLLQISTLLLCVSNNCYFRMSTESSALGQGGRKKRKRVGREKERDKDV